MADHLQDLPVGAANIAITVAAVGNLPAVGLNGEFYFVLAEKALYFWDSTAWKKLAVA